MSSYLTQGKSIKNILLVFVLFILIVVIVPQNIVAGETQPVVNASEILANITRGEPVYINNNSIIVGNLDLSERWKDLPINETSGIKRGVIERPINIKDSTFQGVVNFNPIYFNDTVEFKNVTFEGRTSFFYAVFDKRTIFQDSTFKSSADFGNATFNDRAYFGRVNFRDARFWNATFNNATFFRFSTVYEDAVFDNTFFNKSADFTHFVVERDATFDNATFNDSVDFKLSTFNELAWFMDAKFNGLADFLGVNFNGQVNFEDAKFNAPVNFIQATFSDTTVFQNVVFNFTAYFILAKFKDRTYFTGAVFNDSVDFSDADIFLTMKIRWSQLDGKLVYNNYFYQSLIKNFETLGQSEDWRDAYYEYHVEKRKHLQSPLDPIWETLKASFNLVIFIAGWLLEYSEPRFGLRRLLEFIFLDFSCGYGVRPLRLIGWAGLFIGLFAVLYRRIEDKGMRKSEDRWERFLGFVFLSVSIFTMRGKWNDWEPAKKYIRCFRIATVVEGSLGWILMTLFVISLTMTWIR